MRAVVAGAGDGDGAGAGAGALQDGTELQAG